MIKKKIKKTMKNQIIKKMMKNQMIKKMMKNQMIKKMMKNQKIKEKHDRLQKTKKYIYDLEYTDMKSMRND